MDNLQPQPNNQVTGNPQQLGQSSLAAPNNNIQGSVDNQQQLLKLPSNGLQVTVCQADCQVVGLQPAPAKKSNYATILTSILLLVVLLVLIWRFLAVIRRATVRHPIEEHVVTPEVSQALGEIVVAKSNFDKKTPKKSKKNKRSKRKR